MIYKEYLQSEHWQQKRKEALQYWENRCIICYSTKNLEVHHRTYDNLHNENIKDLVVLCRDCHSKHHFSIINNFKISQLDKDLLEIFIKGNGESLEFIIEKFDVRTIKNPLLIPVFDMMLKQLSEGGDIDLVKIISKIHNIEITSLLLEIQNESSGISTGHKLSENSLLVKSEKRKIDYLKKSKDVIRNIEIRHLETEIELLKSDTENLNIISNLKKEVNKLKTNGKK